MKEVIKKHLDNKPLVAALTYLVFFLPRFTPHKADHDLHFHIKQAIGLLVLALSLQGIISILGYWGMPPWRVWPVRIILLYLVIIGMRNGWKDEKKVLPWIGDYASRAFENIR